MQFLKLAKNMLRYLPMLILLAAITLGLFIGKGLLPTSLESRSQNPLIILSAEGPCNSSNLYMSLPPKCKGLDGKFVPAPGISIAVAPKDK